MVGSNIVAIHVEDEDSANHQDYHLEFQSAETARLTQLKLKGRSDHETITDAFLIPENDTHTYKFGQFEFINSLFN